MAEKLTLDERFGNRGAVDRDERPCLARTQIMERARYQLFAGAALARDQHRDVGGRDLLDQREDVLHCARGAHHRTQNAGFTQPPARYFELNCRLPLPCRIRKDGAQPRCIDGLLQKVVGAHLHRVDRHLNRSLRGQQHDRDVGVDSCGLGHFGEQS